MSHSKSAIAIDYLKVFGTESVLGRGWAKVPKYKSDAKVKIIGIILALRKENTDGKFVLDQTRIISMFSNMWGASRPVNILHFNDRVRLYGIIMSIPSNRHIYQRLAEEVTSRRHIDDPTYSVRQMFQNIVLQFNDERVAVAMPPDFDDLADTEEIDANDNARIRITRDCKYNILF